MAITMAVRGGSMTPRYNLGSPYYVNRGATFSVGADAGALSGSLINMTSATGNLGLVYEGHKNFADNRSFSILARIKNNYTGTPAANRAIFLLGDGIGGRGPFLEVYHNTAGNIIVNGRTIADTNTFAAVNFGAWSPTSGTYYDIFFKWDGTNSSNAGKLYIDATLLGQATPTNALESTWYGSYFPPTVGNGVSATIRNFYLDEFVVWSGDVDPTSVGLVSGTGSLNGASRTSLVDVSALDGSVWTTLSADKIKTGESQTQAGTTVNGTYDGSDRWTDPGIANVRLSTAYKANSTTNNRTGTCNVPQAATVLKDVAVDATVGTLEFKVPSFILSI